MKKLREFLDRMFHPSLLPALLMGITACVLLGYFLSREDKTSFFACLSYALATYVLAFSLVGGIPVAGKRIQEFKESNSRLAMLSRKLFNDRDLRARTSLYGGLVVNILYAVFKLIIGIYYSSIWFGAIAFYYIALSVVRTLLVRRDRKLKQVIGSNHILLEWKSFRSCSFLMLMIDVAMSVMIDQMVRQNRFFEYPGFIIYASAVYTFYRLIVACLGIRVYRKSANPLLYYYKVFNLSTALMALLALQTAMLSTFGSSPVFQQRMNGFTGTVVCLSVLCMAILMIHKSNCQIRQLTEEDNKQIPEEKEK